MGKQCEPFLDALMGPGRLAENIFADSINIYVDSKSVKLYCSRHFHSIRLERDWDRSDSPIENRQEGFVILEGLAGFYI